MGVNQCFGIISNEETDKRNVNQYIKHIKEKNQNKTNYKRHFSCSDAYDSHTSFGAKTLSTIYTATYRSSMMNTSGNTGGFLNCTKVDMGNSDNVEEMNFYMSFASRFPNTRIGQKSLKMLLNDGECDERSKSMGHLRRKKLDAE